MTPALATAYGPLEPSEPGGIPLRAATVEDGIEVRGDDDAPVLERAAGETAEPERRRGDEILVRNSPASAHAVNENVQPLETRKNRIHALFD
jgi:hypothetical protein